MSADREEGTTFPGPPEGEGYATLHQLLLRMQPLLRGWFYRIEHPLPTVYFWGPPGMQCLVTLRDGEFMLDIQAGVAPMEADALRMVLRQRYAPWMPWGLIEEGKVNLFLGGRCPANDPACDPVDIILMGFEAAFQQQGDMDVWWARVSAATSECQA